MGRELLNGTRKESNIKISFVHVRFPTRLRRSEMKKKRKKKKQNQKKKEDLPDLLFLLSA